MGSNQEYEAPTVHVDGLSTVRLRVPPLKRIGLTSNGSCLGVRWSNG